MKLYMIPVLCSLYVRSVNSQDAQEDDTQSVTGPDFFVTDGTKELSLTCGTDTSASVYGWSFPSNDSRLCQSRPATNACTFRPRLNDDMQNVTCAASFQDTSRSFIAKYTLHLFYPPQSHPSLIIEPSKTEPLKQGDNITCTVSGGKLSVTNVTFHCQHPNLADRRDDVSGDGRTVSSSITVDTSQATEVNMTCTCSAHWDPEPELYDIITNVEFMLEYRATVTNFTVNGSTSKTVAESKKVMFWCQGAGRPPPTQILRKWRNGTAVASGSESEKGLLHHIGSARCEDLGTYTCEANNNFPNPNSKTVQLLVTCSTRLADDSVDIANIYNVTQAGRTFTVLGYPTPDIAVVFCGNNTASDCQLAAESAFNKSCKRNQSAEHLVDCTITPVNITEDTTGLYNMTMKNTMGNVTVTFQILHAVTPPQPTTPLDEDVGISTVTIVVIVVPTNGCVLILVIIVIKKKRITFIRMHSHWFGNNATRSESEHTSQPVIAMVQLQECHYQTSEPDYACPFDTIASGMDAQLVAVSFNTNSNSLKSGSADKH